MADTLEVWFKREVLPYEEVLVRFLKRSWAWPDEVIDLRQEVYARVCEAALENRPKYPKAFLISIARHVIVDRRRRERIVSIQAVGDRDFSNDLLEERTPERFIAAQQELARVAEALDRLPARCREVVWMRRVMDLPLKDIAARLGISEKTVEAQVSKGVRMLADYLRRPLPRQPGEPIDDNEDEHGQRSGD